jgi:CRISPR-associated endonuclease/helicase Cas3
VRRAQTIYQALRKEKSSSEIVLVHSRFRPGDRKRALDGLLGGPGQHGTIGVCTQVIEAGVDVSAKLLVTDLAPWPSLVQRVGRCNRTGEYNEGQDAIVVWIKHPDLHDDKKLRPLPYLAEEIRSAAATLARLKDIGPKALPTLTEDMEFTHVIRRKDAIELFDTTPDLAGADIDVSRFIRETDDHDVRVFWRDVAEGETPSPDEARPSREELCAVGIGDLREYLAWRTPAGFRPGHWRWDHVARQWARPEAIYPGLALMLRASEGGYDSKLGWTGKARTTDPIPAVGNEEEDNDGDPYTGKREWATIAAHTDSVVAAVSCIIDSLKPTIEPWRQDLLAAARWHDAGKAHVVFQDAIPAGAPRVDLWAKAELKMKRYGRRGFRHELASALAMLLNGQTDLAAYLAAAHHGKVRLSIRSLPHEKHPDDSEKRFARGIWDGDPLPSTDLGGGTASPETLLDLSFMELGDGPHGPSWLARMLALRDDTALGPFRLGFLESLLRIADWRASGEPRSASEEIQR